MTPAPRWPSLPSLLERRPREAEADHIDRLFAHAGCLLADAERRFDAARRDLREAVEQARREGVIR